MKKSALVMGAVLVGSLLAGSLAFAEGPGDDGGFLHLGLGANVNASANVSTSASSSFKMEEQNELQGEGRMGTNLFGTVSAVNSSTLSVTGKGFGPNAATTTFTVDATSARITKNGSSTTLASVMVGDSVMVQGRASGTVITAVSIKDGFPARGPKEDRHASSSSSTAPFTGNGQPVIAGNVTAIASSTLTVTTKSGIVYTVDAASATILKGNVSSSIANVQVGDTVLVQGAVNGTSITASTVVDQVATAKHEDQGRGNAFGRFFGGIGNFFRHLFGF